jgi:hypothetical protein
VDVGELGVMVEVRETAASTGGEYVEFDVVGRGAAGEPREGDRAGG